MKHFLKETDLNLEERRRVFALSQQYKQQRGCYRWTALSGQSWGLLFYKNSTRTRLSFEVGIHELGGHAIFLSGDTLQTQRGESLGDTARVFSQYLEGLVIRTFGHDELVHLADASSIPVVNGLTDFLHPCQIYSDAFTLAEHWRTEGDTLNSLCGRKLAFLGDTASNMAHSWIIGAALFGMDLALAGPPAFAPDPQVNALLEEAGLQPKYHYTEDPVDAVTSADVVYTDVWVSMGDEAAEQTRLEALRPYAVTEKLMAKAHTEACFMHCMPIHPGQEVSEKVLDSSRSIIYQQAANRLHVQKAILTVLAEAAKA